MLAKHHGRILIAGKSSFQPCLITTTRSLVEHLPRIGEVWLEAVVPLAVGLGHLFTIRMESLGTFGVGKLKRKNLAICSIRYELT